MKTSSKPEYYKIELKDLLSHRARINPFKGDSVLNTLHQFNEFNKTYNNSFYEFSKFLLTLEPIKYDSSEFYKSPNAGYLLATLMLEKVSGKTYDQLIGKLNQDLDVDFQIGWPKQINKFQPNGHLVLNEQGLGKDSVLVVMPDSIFMAWDLWREFQYYCKPSGDLCVSISDYLKFIQYNLKGLNGQDNYLKTKTYDFIFNGEKESSMGWGNRIKNGNHYYGHIGSMCTFYTYTALIKEKRIGIVIMINSGNNESFDGLVRIDKYLENKYAK